MTNRRSHRTYMQRVSRAQQFIPGHVGGRVASAQPVREPARERTRRVGAIQALATTPPTTAMLRNGETSIAAFDVTDAQIIWVQGCTIGTAPPTGFTKVAESSLIPMQVYTCDGWQSGMGTSLNGATWGSIMLATKGGVGSMWRVNIYDETQHYNPTEGPVTLQASTATMRYQCLAGSNWYSYWRAPTPNFNAMAGGGAQFPLHVSPYTVHYGWGDAETLLVDQVQSEGDFNHTDIGVYGEPRSVSFNLEWG